MFEFAVEVPFRIKVCLRKQHYPKMRFFMIKTDEHKRCLNCFEFGGDGQQALMNCCSVI